MPIVIHDSGWFLHSVELDFVRHNCDCPSRKCPPNLLKFSPIETIRKSDRRIWDGETYTNFSKPIRTILYDGCGFFFQTTGFFFILVVTGGHPGIASNIARFDFTLQYVFVREFDLFISFFRTNFFGEFSANLGLGMLEYEEGTLMPELQELAFDDIHDARKFFAGGDLVELVNMIKMKL